ncbi:unnamed protein product, partial [Mesorhabditis belari]|uniref:17-beta-hydroxysteroid dehydrogenase type 6 n=1 Tax=Mesorhabditis belari TaxID=2138241 RepID=A0AAF3EQR6_9BILA
MLCTCTLLLLIPLYYVLRWVWELFKVKDLEKRAVLITGCDSGFGFKIALQCARAGIPTFAACLTQQGIEKLKKEENSSKLRPFQLDVTKDESVQQAVKFVDSNLKNGEYLWGLVQNAGVFTIHGPDDFMNAQHYQYSFDVNCLGCIRVTQAFKKHIKKCQGRIIATSSVSGRVAFPGTGAYAVGKYGVEAYIDALRQELYPWGVKCSILEPGAFKTPLLDHQMHKNRVNKAWSQVDDETKAEYGEKYKDFIIESWNKALDTMASSNLAYVTDAYFHAITAQYPRKRYRCGWDSIFFYIPISLVPTELQDWIFRALISKENKGNVEPAVFAKKKTN